jgi:hypothetical protein
VADMVSRLAIALVLLCGCGGECVIDSDCERGNYCSSGACITDCATDDECTAMFGPSSRCSSFGRCVAPSDAGLPPCTTGTDQDFDGYCSLDTGGDDCDDGDPSIHPGASEICTSADSPARDENCNTAVDEACPWYFGRPHVVLAVHVDANARHVGPQLSLDGNELSFSANPGGTNYSVFRGARTSASEPFGTASAASAFASGESVGWASIRSDGFEVYYELAGMDTVVRASRTSTDVAFGTSAPVLTNARQPSLSRDGLELYVERTMPSPSRIARAVRTSLDGTFATFDDVALSGDTLRDSSPFLTPDLHTLLFVRELPTGHSRLYAAERSGPSDPFGAPIELADIVLPSPMLEGVAFSPQTRELFFGSAGDWAPAPVAIFRSEVCRDGPCEDRVIACEEGLRSADRLHCYRAFATTAAWDAAQMRCEGRGGHLATVHSAAEFDVVRALTGTTNSWLGGTDAPTEGTWRWVTGEPWLSTFWASPQPDNAGAGENCLVSPCNGCTPVSSNWNDLSCATSVPYVCENETWPTW